MHALVMDGDPPAAFAISHMLAGAGWAVDHASSAEQGIILTQRNSYDVVIADFMLPDLSGRQLVHRIRGMSLARPLLILSRVDDANARTTAMEAGADAYMKKPIDRRRLLETLEKLLENPMVAAPLPPSSGSLVLSRGNLSVRHGASLAFPALPSNHRLSQKAK